MEFVTDANSTLYVYLEDEDVNFMLMLTIIAAYMWLSQEPTNTVLESGRMQRQERG